MKTLINFLSHTPTYVYALFAYLLFKGIRAGKDRVVSFYKTLITPCIFLLLTLKGLSKLSLPFLGLFTLVWLASGCLGWFQVAFKTIFVDKKKSLLALPGSWVTLILMLLIFSTKYYLGYQTHQNPAFPLTLQANIVMSCTSGFSLGLLFGRVLNYFYRFKTHQHKDLIKGNGV